MNILQTYINVEQCIEQEELTILSLAEQAEQDDINYVL